MKRHSFWGILTAAVCAFSAHSSIASAAEYDGKWSVHITTNQGGCARTKQYDVNVANGRIHYFSYTSVSMYGVVAPDGRVIVSLRHFDDKAEGTGRLSGQSGTGDWKGVGKFAACAGRWEAQRR